MRRLPGPAVDRLGQEGNFRCHLRIVSGLAENTNSIFCDSSSELEAANGCPVLREAGTTSREAHMRKEDPVPRVLLRLAQAKVKVVEACCTCASATLSMASLRLRCSTPGSFERS